MHPFFPSAATGAFAGGIGSLLSGAANSKEVIRNALASAALAGGIGGGGYEVGKALAGQPDPNDPQAYTKRTALGGGIGGALAGGALGALSHLGPDDILLFKQLQKIPRGKAALLGALGFGAYGAYHGAEEGLLQDAIHQNKMREAYANE